MTDVIEGVDYIFDRYAYLGLEIGADRKTIERVIRDRRAGLHPDRLIHVDEDIKKQADAKRDKIDKCAAILLNDELRPLYDERLKEFYARDARMVSTEGHPIINLAAERFSIDMLLSQDIPDTAVLELKIREMTQFDEKKFAEVKTLYGAMPGNAQVGKIYKDALTTKLIYLELLEDTAWAKIGYTRKTQKADGHVLFASDYTEKVEAELTRVSGEVIEDAVRQRNEALRIGVAAPLLLLEDQREGVARSVQPRAMDEETQEKIKNQARRNFEIRADYVREVARMKQEVLQELVTLAEVQELSPRDETDPEYEIYLVQPDARNTVLARFNLAAADANSAMDGSFTPGGPLSEVAKAARKTNALAVIRNNEITDLFMEVTQVCNKICETWEQTHKPPAPAP